MVRNPKVSIIVLNWNEPDLTVNCLRSVLEQSYRDFEVLLVDNGSTNDSVDIFERVFGGGGRIRIIRNSTNLGYAGGNNEGVKRARGEYIAILNNDTLVESDWLARLVEALESDNDIKIVFSRVIVVREAMDRLDKDRLAKYDNEQRYGGVLTLLNYGAYLDDGRNKAPLIDFTQAAGSAFIYRKDVVALPFDPEYFCYAEDIYFNWLVRMMGYKVKLATTSKAYHFHNTGRQSSRRMSRYLTYLGERNRLMNIFIFYEVGTLLKLLPMLAINLLLINLFELRKTPCRIASYLWLIFHPLKICAKRTYIQGCRKMPDAELISGMSCLLREESHVRNRFFRYILRAVNRVFYLYCCTIGLNAAEIRRGYFSRMNPA